MFSSAPCDRPEHRGGRRQLFNVEQHRYHLQRDDVRGLIAISIAGAGMLGRYLARWRRDASETAAPLIALAATLGLMWFLNSQGVPLRNPVAPSGVISLQLAWHSQQATDIVRSWDALKWRATVQVLSDFPFIAAYAYLLFAIGNAAARDAGCRERPQLVRFAEYAAVAGLAAGCLDVVENFGLLTMIWLTAQQPLPLLTALAAAAKFALIVISFLVSMTILLWPVRRPMA